MTILEFKKILEDLSMNNKKTNIRIVKDKKGGGNKNPDKPSTRQILLDFIKEQRKFNQFVIKKIEQYDKLFKKHKWIK